MTTVVASLAAAGTAFSMRAWAHSDPRFKLALVTNMIKLWSQHHVAIRRPAEYYVHELDLEVKNSLVNGTSALDPDVSVGAAFRTIAVMDCDWDDGRDRLASAKEWLGPEMEMVRQRYPEKYKRLRNGCK